VYSKADLIHIYIQIQEATGIPKRITPTKFIDLLLRQDILHELLPVSPYSSPPKRYVLQEFSMYELACSIKKDAYLSHGTAAFLQGISAQQHKTIYVNKEQSIKPQSLSNSLTQEALSSAFSRKQRESNYVLRYGKASITLLNGKNTGRLGVHKIQGEIGKAVDVTDIERTLIDITVRPAYAGGVDHVLQCYVNARKLISVTKLIDTLGKIGYMYPYHQAVGFYMQKAGFDPASWSALQEKGLQFDFFLAHGITKPAYDPVWRVFFAKGLLE
jgi:hypothetical protein